MSEIRERFEALQYGPYSQRRMAERGIAPQLLREAIFSADAEIIEDYGEDARGHSCLVLGFVEGRRPLHVVIALEEMFLITVYDPSMDPQDRWEDYWKTRRERTSEDMRP